MYHDFLGREIEDLEWDNMRRDAYEDAHSLAGILSSDPDAVAQAEQNGLIYTCRETYDPHTGAIWTTLTVANESNPPYQSTDFDCADDIVEAYPGLKWSAVEEV